MREIETSARTEAGAKVAQLISRSLAAFADEEFELSAELAGKAKDLAPHSARVMELLGLGLYHQGRWKEAVKELLAYRRLTSLTDQNHVIADCYRAQGKPDRALELCAEVDRESVAPETWAETAIVAAGALSDKGDLRGAIAMLNRSDTTPDTIEAHHLRLWYVLADLSERAGRGREAAELWERIVAEDPEFFDSAERLERSRT